MNRHDFEGCGFREAGLQFAIKKILFLQLHLPLFAAAGVLRNQNGRALHDDMLVDARITILRRVQRIIKIEG